MTVPTYAAAPEWGNLDIIDIQKYMEGELLGYWVGGNFFDWSVQDPYLKETDGPQAQPQVP